MAPLVLAIVAIAALVSGTVACGTVVFAQNRLLSENK
jgi:uncharacterized membrane protein YczE